MAEFSWKTGTTYAFASVLGVWGLVMILGDSDPPAPQPAPPNAQGAVIEFDPTEGITGISGVNLMPQSAGNRQVKLLENDEYRVPQLRPAKPEEEMSEKISREMRGASPELKETLDKLGGLPTYVEGLDRASQRNKKR